MGQLPFASKEVQRAADLIDGKYRLNQEASLRNFLKESAKANILHLSMHGLLRSNPMESALVFRGEGEEEFALLEMKDVLGGNYPAQLTQGLLNCQDSGPVFKLRKPVCSFFMLVCHFFNGYFAF